MQPEPRKGLLSLAPDVLQDLLDSVVFWSLTDEEEEDEYLSNHFGLRPALRAVLKLRLVSRQILPFVEKAAYAYMDLCDKVPLHSLYKLQDLLSHAPWKPARYVRTLRLDLLGYDFDEEEVGKRMELFNIITKDMCNLQSLSVWLPATPTYGSLLRQLSTTSLHTLELGSGASEGFEVSLSLITGVLRRNPIAYLRLQGVEIVEHHVGDACRPPAEMPHLQRESVTLFCQMRVYPEPQTFAKFARFIGPALSTLRFNLECSDERPLLKKAFAGAQSVLENAPGLEDVDLRQYTYEEVRLPTSIPAILSLPSLKSLYLFAYLTFTTDFWSNLPPTLEELYLQCKDEDLPLQRLANALSDDRFLPRLRTLALQTRDVETDEQRESAVEALMRQIKRRRLQTCYIKL